MKPKAYVETSVVSYLTALPSVDVVRAGQQTITQKWWSAREAFDLFISQFVLDEAAQGDPEAADRRLAALDDISLLDATADATSLAESLVAGGGLPPKARVDSFHVAIATVHGMDYLLSWNCKHIANAMLRGGIEAICRAAGYEPPVICTPLELVEE